jgi:hypothetical protein
MGNQKVPGRVVLPCNGWIYGNAYLITCSTDPAIVANIGESLLFGIIPSSAVTFDSMSSAVAKCVPLRPTCRVGNSQKSFGVRSGQYWGWVMPGKFFSARNSQEAMCGSERYSHVESTVHASCAASSELRSATSAKLAPRYDQWHCVQAGELKAAPKRRCQRIPGTFWLPLVYKQSKEREVLSKHFAPQLKPTRKMRHVCTSIMCDMGLQSYVENWNVTFHDLQ